MNHSIPRIVLAALRGGSGKTIVSLGLIGALVRQGIKICPFKKGPDYIDARWLASAAASPCYNLDPFLMDNETIVSSLVSRTKDGSFAVIEGNRGIFDGFDAAGSSSTAELAKLLNSAVLLVIDCTKATRTMAAMVLGCQNLDPQLRVSGVILNKIATPRHENIVTKAIETYTDTPVLGAIPRLRKDPLPMRHLGVTPADEHPEALSALKQLASLIQANVDLERIKQIANAQPPLALPDHVQSCNPMVEGRYSDGRPAIGVIKDAAFQFYYPENLEALESAGARIVFLNSLTDRGLPELDALYVGGGFPETHARELEKNRDFRDELKTAIEKGLPVYAECGGLMYLGRRIIWKEKAYMMVGALGWDFVIEKRPVGHGYTILEAMKGNPYFAPGEQIRGHEFHYSNPVLSDEATSGYPTFKVLRGHGFQGKLEGITRKNILATYTHIHARGNRIWAYSLVKAAKAFRHGKKALKMDPGHENTDH